MFEGASKQTLDLRILPRRDRAPRFEIPGSAHASLQLGFEQWAWCHIVNYDIYAKGVNTKFTI